MKKLILLTPLFLFAGGVGAWLMRDRLSSAPPVADERADYDAFVADLGGDESAIRDELNELVYNASAPFDPADRLRANALTRECLDCNVLLRIGVVRDFIASRGEGQAFHFVSSAHRTELRAIAGEHPPAERVIAIRKELAKVANGFASMRQPADWSIKIEGDTPPSMPFLQLLNDTPKTFPASQHPVLRANPRVPVFSGSDGELLVQLNRFFNSSGVRAALPPSQFPKLYREGRIPPIPTAISEYQGEIGALVLAEQHILLPGDSADAAGVQALSDVYGRLARFLSAIAAFER